MNIIITGGHSGIGLELTRLLLSEGHRVGIIVRSSQRKSDALQLFSASPQPEIFVADLSKREEIYAVATQIKEVWERLDGLFNNAGLLLDKLYYSDYGNELQLEVNGLSPFLLTQALKPLLDKADQPFVVNTATGGLNNRKSIDVSAFKRPKKFTKLTGSYMDSKLIMVLLMNHLNEKWENVRFVSVNPGAIKTQMTAGDGMPFWLKPIRNLLFMSPQRGAQSLYNAAFNEKYIGSGIFISEGKIRSMKYAIKQSEVNELFSVNS